jgi:hypothetical protein
MVVAGTAPIAAQQPPPIHGVTGTIATDTSIQETTAGGNRVLAKIGSFFGLKRSAAPNDAAAAEALHSLPKGTRIVLQYASPREGAAGEQPTVEVDAEVVSVNVADRTIAIALADGGRQTLRLAQPGETDVANIVVYFKDRPGQRVARAFKRVA